MASFVIHTIAADTLLKTLREKYNINFSEEQKNEFLLGNLIVDSTRIKFKEEEGISLQELRNIYRRLIQEEKIQTHFRDEDDTDLCIQVPNISKFEHKYNSLLKESVAALGYLFHLYTDKIFFEKLFVEAFETLDENMKPTIYTSMTRLMRVTKNNKLYTINDFWNGDSKFSIYHDYTVMNKILLEYFNITFDKETLLSYGQVLQNPGIEEVDFNNIANVINMTDSYISQSYQEKESTLNIFDEEKIKKFINYISNSFIEKYLELFEIQNIKVNKKVKHI